MAEQDSNEQTFYRNPDDLKAPQNEAQSEQILGGRYKILSELGRGGMGVVYKVQQVFLGKEFALKTIEKHSLSDQTARRFQHEARASFAVDHPNIVSVHDFGLLDDGTPFLVMDYLEGQTLADLLSQRTRLTVEDAIPIFVQICFGLAHAHEHHVIHRDIKPGNIILMDGVDYGTEGSVKILDFGIAKLASHEGGEIQALTRTGEIFGSPLYMSPEQCGGDKVDQRSDIYSFGCMLFEALTGATPFIGENALATMMMHLNDAPPTLKEASLGEIYPESLERVVKRLLAKKPEERYDNLGRVALDLSAITRGDKIATDPRAGKRLSISSAQTDFRISKINLVMLLVVVALLSAGLAAMVVQSIKTRQDAGSVTLPPVSDAVRRLSETKEQSLLGSLGDDFEKPRSIKAQLAHSDGKTLKLVGCNIDTALMRQIGATKVTSLDLQTATFENQDLIFLKHVPLTRLAAMSSSLNDAGAVCLAECETLRTIKASKTNLTDKGLAYLSQLPQLKEIKLNYTNVTFAGVCALCKNSKVSKVFLGHCAGIDASQLAQLKAKFPNVKFSLKGEELDDFTDERPDAVRLD